MFIATLALSPGPSPLEGVGDEATSGLCSYSARWSVMRGQLYIVGSCNPNLPQIIGAKSPSFYINNILTHEPQEDHIDQNVVYTPV